MKFVQIAKVQPTGHYALSQCENITIKDITPASVTVDITDYIDAKAFQKMTLWYLRGTRFTCFGIALQNKYPKIEYRYSYTTAMPAAYAKRCRTMQDVEAMNKRLVDNVYKKNRIPFGILEDGYKVVARYLEYLDIRYSSPNEKTALEVRAERQLKRELSELDNGYVAHYTDIERAYYSTLFNINAPTFAVKLNHVKTRHGFACLPQLQQTADMSFFNGSYAGSDSDYIAKPYTMSRDERPIPVMSAKQLQTVEASIDYFLTLPNEIQKEFLNLNYDKCAHCGFYNIHEGCDCGKHPPIEEVRQSEYTNYLLTH